jgi:Fic family protein
MTTEFDTVDKIRESLRIERIYREPNEHEIEEYNRFLALKTVSIHDLQVFVGVYQPGHALREKPEQNMTIVGGRVCPEGGAHIRQELQFLLDRLNNGHITPWMFHGEYEMLHPFSDCNGRSGRMIWYWQMGALSLSTGLGFLHTYYYQALAQYGREVLWNRR